MYFNVNCKDVRNHQTLADHQHLSAGHISPACPVLDPDPRLHVRTSTNFCYYDLYPGNYLSSLSTENKNGQMYLKNTIIKKKNQIYNLNYGLPPLLDSS